MSTSCRVDEWLRRNAVERADRLALDDGSRRVTHAELMAIVDRVRASVGPLPAGSVIALLANPDIAGVAALLGLATSHIVVAPINTRLTVTELTHYLERIDPALVVAHPDLRPMGIRWPVAELGHLGIVERPATVPLSTSAHRIDDDGAAVIFPTGGTTGLPKGALWSAPALATAIESSVINLRVESNDCELYISPLAHVTVIPGFLATLAVGGTVLLQPRFDARAAADMILHRGVTRMFGTPTAISRLLDELPEPLPGNRIKLVYGAARSSERFRDRLRQMFPDGRFYSGYGATEVGAVVRLKPEHDAADPGVGRAVDGVRISILDPHGRPLPSGERGDVAIYSPWACVRYVGSDADGPRRLDDGSVVMGDIGWLDDDGYLHLDGRRSEMIKTGGENVFPAEVESVLLTHPAVADAAVYGVPDEDWGEEVRALVVPRPTVVVTPDELITHCRRVLAGFKTPKRVVLTDRLPMTASLKIDRRAVVDAAISAEEEPC